MSIALHGDRHCCLSHRLRMAFCTVTLLLAVGCPGLPAGTDNDNSDGTNTNGTDGEITGQILNVSRTVQISELEEPLSILYSVTASNQAGITSFYVPLGGTEEDRVGIDTTSPLLAGNGQFPFDPQVTGVGTFRVGLVITDGGDEKTITCEGMIQVQGRPDPVFVQPSGLVEIVRAGVEVTIRFDAGDPEGFVRWRVFYLTASDSRNVPADQLGTQIGPPGSGNVGGRVFATIGLAAGDYQIGISATDTGDSIATAVDKGDDDRIVTVFGPIIRLLADDASPPPTVAILAPSSADVALFGDQSFTVEVRAQVFDPGGGQLEVFYDTDMKLTNGFAATIGAVTVSASASDDEPQTLSFALPTDLAEGTYYIGASITDGINATVSTYALGTIEIIRVPTLAVTAPDLALPIAPSVQDVAEVDVRVSWSTNVPPTAGTVDVFARKLSKDGTPFGAEIEILPPGPTTVSNAVFNPVQSGVYEVTVRLTLADPSVNVIGLCTAGTCIETAPQPVRVTTLPRILWLGSLAQENPAFEGAIFQGIDAEDNLGSSVMSAGDLDSDGKGDFVLAARYADSFVDYTTAVGPGEAYVIYGDSGSSKLLGVYDAGSVGSSLLRGVRIFGINTIGGTDATDGLASIALIPDVDGDSKGELAFGFPEVNSACPTDTPLCTTGQFRNGGVVLVSSANSGLADPEGGERSIACNEVGQYFTDMSTAGTATLVVEDRRVFDSGTAACRTGTDQRPDTIVGPAEGFIPLFASPDDGGFVTIAPGTTPAQNVCVTQYAVPPCVDADDVEVFGGNVVGSGFYPASADAVEPFGARIIGQSVGDGFGTSISTTSTVAEGTRGGLIISAPNRHAKASEVDGLSADINSSGVAFLAFNRTLWGVDGVVGGDPPTPHQFSIGVSNFCGEGRTPPLLPARIAGAAIDNIQNVVGIRDFNGDGFSDIAVGVPTAYGGEGLVYVVFRSPAPSDVILGDLTRGTTDPRRPDGVLITSTSIAGLGASIATDVDFNGDGSADLVIGAPNAESGTGEVIVVFSSSDIESPAGGISVATLLAIRGPTGLARAARITGSTVGNEQTFFGYNVANAGDVNGDGFNDLLIAAPSASPRFDADPSDTTDELTALGIDLDFDGTKDDVSGPEGFPDGVTNDYDSLLNAGVVYVVYGGSRLDQILNADLTIGIEELGSSLLRGFMITGRSAGDRLGGGDAGDSSEGGIVEKRDRGRSHGLGSAGDVDRDGRADILIGAVLADPLGNTNAGEAYLIHGSAAQ